MSEPLAYADPATPRPGSGHWAAVQEGDGLRLIHGPVGWGCTSVIGLLGVSFIVIAGCLAGVAIVDQSGGMSRGGGQVLGFMLVAVVLPLGLFVKWMWRAEFRRARRVTHLKIDAAQLSLIPDFGVGERPRHWARDAIARVVAQSAGRRWGSGSLLLELQSGERVLLIDPLSAADAHAMAAACNAALAKN